MHDITMLLSWYHMFIHIKIQPVLYTEIICIDIMSDLHCLLLHGDIMSDLHCLLLHSDIMSDLHCLLLHSDIMSDLHCLLLHSDIMSDLHCLLLHSELLWYSPKMYNGTNNNAFRGKTQPAKQHDFHNRPDEMILSTHHQEFQSADCIHVINPLTSSSFTVNIMRTN